MARTIQLESGLELRPALRSDAPVIFAAIQRNHARLREFLPWVSPTYGESDAVRHLEQRERENTAHEALAVHIWMQNELCGAISLHKIDPLHKSTSIGYWLDSAYEGRGIMTMACRAITSEGFRNYGLHRIEIRCAVENEKSSSIPRRLGFVEEGILRQAEWMHDHWIDLRVFSMLQQDWESAS